MRNRFWGLVVLCAVFFAACDDDDDNGNGVTYSGDNLSLTVAGMQLDDREATLDGSTLTVKQAIPGETETVFQVENDGSRLSGTNSNENRDVTLDGTINGNGLDLTLTMDVKHKLAAQWDVAGLIFDIETSQETVQIGESEIPVKEFVSRVENIGSALPLIMPYLNLQQNGNVTAYYAANLLDIIQNVDFTDYSSILGILGQLNYATSPEGMAIYNVIGQEIYVTLDLAGIVNDAMASTPSTQAMQYSRAESNILDSFSNGIPLLWRDNSTTSGVDVYVTREMMLPVVQALPGLFAILANQNENLNSLTPIVTAVCQLIENSDSCELGLQLSPHTDTATTGE